MRLGGSMAGARCALLLIIFVLCAEGHFNWDRYLIPCHTTDYICFKRQYKWLRDHALLGNEGLGIPHYEPHEFVYGDSGTCVRISGLEHSELVGISMDSTLQEYLIMLELPLKVQQVKANKHCVQPKHEFDTNQFYGSDLHTFTGNASVYAKFPYTLGQVNHTTRLDLMEADLDVVLDIADLSLSSTENFDDLQEYYASEWAYNAVQHFDAAEAIFSPFMDNLRKALQAPLKKYIMLYPDEEYGSLVFGFSEGSYREEMCRNL